MSDRIFFHIDTNNINKDKFALDNSESHHFINVLRKPIGTEIWLTDGNGNVYQAITEMISNRIVTGRINNKYPNYGENKYKIILGVGIIKRDKMEFVVEKATECGVNAVVPIVMDRSIKRDVNIERLKKISFTAVKQCGRSNIPQIHEPIKFSDYLDQNNIPILTFHESGISLDAKISDKIKNYKEILVLIGPEGDFSKQELILLKSKGASLINLGDRRLRSETAVITALSQINLIIS